MSTRVIKHPSFAEMKRTVPAMEVQDWLDQGWLLDDGPLFAEGGKTEAQKAPKPGPKA